MKNGHIIASNKLVQSIKNTPSTYTTPSKDVNVLLSLNEWVLNEDNTYSQEIEIRGLEEDTNPIIVLNPATEKATDDELLSYSYIVRTEITGNVIKFIAINKPVIELNVVIKGVDASVDIDELEAKIEELKAELKWKFIDSKLGRESILLPSDFSEILVVVEMPYTGFPLGVSFVLSKNDLVYETRYFDSGSPNAYARIGVSTSIVTINHAFCYNTEYSGSVITKVYYR